MSQLKSQIKPFDISKWEVKKAWEEVRANKVPREWTGRVSRTSRRICRGTCTRSGIGCRRAPTFRPRCARWRSRSRTAAAAECSAFPLSPTGWPRPWWPGICCGGWSRCSIPTATDTGPDGPPWMRWGHAGSGVGSGTGWSSSTSRSSSTACPGTCWSRRWMLTPMPAWVMLYVRRWLAAPLVMPDGLLVERERGTPQGAPVSPVLANLFLHVCHERRRGVGCR